MGIEVIDEYGHRRMYESLYECVFFYSGISYRNKEDKLNERKICRNCYFIKNTGMSNRIDDNCAKWRFLSEDIINEKRFQAFLFRHLIRLNCGEEALENWNKTHDHDDNEIKIGGNI